MKIRVGFGYDVHQLKDGHPFYLGGVLLEEAVKGAFGHSDADVLLHTICDALLGAANLRDIGFHFPPTDQAYKGINSLKLLSRVNELLNSKQYQISNIDATVVLEAPKVNPYIPKMQEAIANCLGIEEDDISIKATTSEKIGFVGREEGVAAYATVLIYKG